jgi:hypothetical protein
MNDRGAIAWEAESLRMTVFVARPVATGLEKVWLLLQGAEPEILTASPKAGTRQLEGPLNTGRLTMLESPGRVDLVNTAQSPLQAAITVDGPTSIAPLADALAEFMPLATRWLSALEVPVTRVAFGATLSGAPCSDRAAAYRALQPYLPSLRLDPDTSSDFTYQINRFRQSAVPALRGVVLNRLMKWAAILRYQALFQVPLSQQATAGPAVVRMHNAVTRPHVEVDINTAAERIEPLPPEAFVALVQELQDLVIEIADKGDIS